MHFREWLRVATPSHVRSLPKDQRAGSSLKLRAKETRGIGITGMKKPTSDLRLAKDEDRYLSTIGEMDEGAKRSRNVLLSLMDMNKNANSLAKWKKLRCKAWKILDELTSRFMMI